MPVTNATTRFSNRVEQYGLYRPAYPEEVIRYLEKTIGLTPSSVIADIGSGTGIFTGLLVHHGYQVHAVEPNGDMRAEAEKNINNIRGFHSVSGSAEHTTLPDHSIDLITAAQAFHWFDRDAVKREFARILKPPGCVALIWNILRKDTPFLSAFQALKEKYSEGFAYNSHADLESLTGFFYPSPVTLQVFPMLHALHAEGLRGLFLSFSAIPLQKDSRFEKMLDELDNLFQQHERNGMVELLYDTKVYLSQIDTL